jgi:hypothetical protein
MLVPGPPTVVPKNTWTSLAERPDSITQCPAVMTVRDDTSVPLQNSEPSVVNATTAVSVLSAKPLMIRGTRGPRPVEDDWDPHETTRSSKKPITIGRRRNMGTSIEGPVFQQGRPG